MAHAAPEVLQGQRANDLSDVYSLGSTLYALLAGAPAFVHSTDESIIPIIARERANLFPDLRLLGVPGGFATVVEAAMAKEPGERLVCSIWADPSSSSSEKLGCRSPRCAPARRSS